MTLDEAIKHAEEVMVENLEKTKGRNASDPIAINCFECAKEHRQLAEWLKDYKRLLEQQPCEDAINRQAAIDEIEYELEMINSALDSMTLDFNARERLRQRRGEAREILNSIQQLPHVTPQPRWIPVSERLPEEFQRVLVTIVNYNGDNVVRVAVYLHGIYRGIFLIKENHEQWEVGEEGLLAWMSLPEPYKTESEEV